WEIYTFDISFIQALHNRASGSGKQTCFELGCGFAMNKLKQSTCFVNLGSEKLLRNTFIWSHVKLLKYGELRSNIQFKI
ncbi:hypothetical protein Ocin01_08248, partial [Orchesella cincta]